MNIGYFDESLKICEDYDFWLRLLLEFQLGVIDEALVEKHGGHSDQLSNSTWGLDRFRVQSLEKIQQLPNTPFRIKRKFSKPFFENANFSNTAFLKHEKLEEAEIYLQKKHRASKKASRKFEKSYQTMNFVVAFQAEAQPIIERFNLIKSAELCTLRLYTKMNHRLGDYGYRNNTPCIRSHQLPNRTN